MRSIDARLLTIRLGHDPRALPAHALSTSEYANTLHCNNTVMNTVSRAGSSKQQQQASINAVLNIVI